MLRVYVAGAYSAPDVLTVIDNMRRGLRLAAQVQAAGFAPYVPWEDILRHLVADGAFTLADCYDRSLAWLEVADAVLVQPERAGTSKGTQAELRRAAELNIPIFWTLKELKRWATSR